MAIDNPIDKVREILNERDDDLLDGLIQAAACFEPITAVIAAVKEVTGSRERSNRVRVAIRALCDELERLRVDLPSDAKVALNSEWFTRAVSVMIEQAVWGASEGKSRICEGDNSGCIWSADPGSWTATNCLGAKVAGGIESAVCRSIMP
jgi:hypothetical protein